VTRVWQQIHAERAALAADLADLTDQQWVTPSLCAGLNGDGVASLRDHCETR
jgi:hypothetical protein